MSYLFPTYAKWEVKAESGHGATLIDDNGKEYLDFISGIAVCNLGHNHPKVNKAVQEQLNKLWHTSNLFQIKGQEEVAELLVTNSCADYVFFSNSGAEANEAAIKLARKATNKHKIITLKNSFHGRTFATMTATGQEKIHSGFGPLVSSFVYAPINDIHALESLIDDEVAAIMIEVVQGEGGVQLLSASYIEQLKQLLNKHDILLIVDEIQTGIGRTGRPFAYMHYDLSPDIVTVAKGLGNGFPVGAMLGKASLRDYFTAGVHGSTFGGNPLAMSAAKAVLTEVFQESFLEEVRQHSEQFLENLRSTFKECSLVKEVRGLGFLIGIECQIPVDKILKACRDKGLLVLQAGPNVIRILPPLIVTTEQLNQAIDILSGVIQEVSQKEKSSIEA
ncbi:acetylornithine aminotransferase [Bacillus sp. TS-2]|nr:acetylornithine aminotransferase [Bacillus sp. TS-2]